MALASDTAFALGGVTCPTLRPTLGFGDEAGGVVGELLVHTVRPLLAPDLAAWFRPDLLKWARHDADDEAVAPSTLPSYDPRVIEQFADKLYRKASSFVAGSIVIGGALGALFGAVPLTSFGNSWPIPSTFGFATLLVGALCGGVVGYVLGDTRSFGYRLQAQAALCQLQIERNTAFVAAAVSVARAAPKDPSQQQQQPAPAVTPPVSAARVA